MDGQRSITMYTGPEKEDQHKRGQNMERLPDNAYDFYFDTTEAYFKEADEDEEDQEDEDE